jgi:HD-GYP domain-containing protein (c-di-GMP phosphodiesterase class II)
MHRSRSGERVPAIEPLCCTPAPIRLPNVSPEDLTQRIAVLEAQSAEAMRNVQRLYDAERERARELEVTRVQMLAYADDLRTAFAAERARRAELERAYVETVRVLACAIEARDPYTGGHVDRVATYSTAIGRELGWKEEVLRALEIGGLLHDIGKIGVADAILRKSGPLDEDEWRLMRQHPTIGASLVGNLAALQPAVPAVLHHHERIDGTGYPAGLVGEAIPEVARIVAVADAFDAMVTDRPYRRGLDLEMAIEELSRCSGTQLDPEFTGAFLELLRSGRMRPLRMGSTLN